MAALLNFAPYVGPLIGVALMLLVGFVEFPDPLKAILPAACYVALCVFAISSGRAPARQATAGVTVH
jgi:predicted PurR-regulated permease PerM